MGWQVAVTDYIEPDGYIVRAARALYRALTDDRTDQRPWEEIPDHRRERYIRAAGIVADELAVERRRANVIQLRSKERSA